MSTYHVFWSEEDQDWVATCDDYPSVSYLSVDRVEAFAGLIDVIENIEEDILNGGTDG